MVWPFDPEFYAGQLHAGTPHDVDYDFAIHRLKHGGIPKDNPLLVGRISAAVQRALGWSACEIYASSDFAQKVVFKHNGVDLRIIERVVREGVPYVDVKRGPNRWLTFVLPDLRTEKCFVLPCKLDRTKRRILAKTLLHIRLRYSHWETMRRLESGS